MLDYLVYTQSDLDQDNLSSRDVAPPPTLAVLVDNSTTNEGTRKHNIATFAGAIGGSVGVLVLLSSGLAFSIIKRRRSYERRERDRERAALEGQADDDSPPMIGPRPFIPRFFPETNTVIPPPYEESTPDNASRSDISHPHSNPSNPENLIPATPPTHSLPVSAHLDRADHDDTSYANIPPSTPPPPLEDIDSLPPPPPFTPGMATPDVRIVHAI
ncbi:hypothetical protein H0H93_013400 [Arthromyces matolae]|nr:hypothetical protein H0H93_013400 [Arthromyces matolae]